jgi:hypothetical protein
MDTELVEYGREEVFSPEEFCSFSKLSYDTFQRFRKRGEGPKELRIGNTVRILKSDAIDWMRSFRR